MLLGAPESWSRSAPLAPPRWFGDEIRIFAEAAQLAASGAVSAARERFATLRQNEARDWFVEHAQISGLHRIRALGGARTATSSGMPRIVTPPSIRRRAWERDRYHCRYCGLPTIHESVRMALQAVVGTDVISWGGTNAQRHGIAFIARTEYDHVEPLSAGGSNDESNVVTACPGCNYGKDRFTVEEIRLDDPRERPPILSDWDGLTSLVPALKRIARSSSA